MQATDDRGVPLPPLFKIIGPNGEPLNGGSGDWPLPSKTEPSDWREIVGELRPCANGLHLASAKQLASWFPRYSVPFVVYRAETDGAVISQPDKYIAARVRLLPSAKPWPSLALAAKRRDAAIAKAQKAADRAAMRLGDASGYMAAIGRMRLPLGHPMRAKLDAYAAAKTAIETEHRTAILAATKAYDAVVARALASLA